MPFQEFLINRKSYLIVTPDKVFEPSYRRELSNLLLEKYGSNISNENTIAALLDCHEYFISKFIAALSQVRDIMFYLFVFNLHEQTAELSYLRSVDGEEIPVEREYFAQYRRILKMILQQACSAEISESYHPSPKWMEATLKKLEELIFLGTFALDTVNAISEQKLTGRSIQITFKDDLYILGHPSEWEGFFGLFYENYDDQVDGSIHDETLQDRFDTVLKAEFQIDLNELRLIIANVANRLYNEMPPRICMLSELTEIFKAESTSQHIESFVQGLILNKENVASLKSGILSPYNGNRLIHRPLLRVDLDSIPCILFDEYTFLEAINTLFQNQITHGKLPKEWRSIPKIKTIWQELVAYHKDILENPVENLLLKKKIPHERNVKTLKATNHYQNLSINETPGEIDFIFILGNTIYLADCKNLTKRYEMHGYYQDVAKFEPYIGKMSEKIAFMQSNQDKLERHLRIVMHDDSLDISTLNIRGIFIVNTPTLYSVNAPFRIYSFYNFELLLDGEDVFDDVVCVPDSEQTEISWPYTDNYKLYLEQNK